MQSEEPALKCQNSFQSMKTIKESYRSDFWQTAILAAESLSEALRHHMAQRCSAPLVCDQHIKMTKDIKGYSLEIETCYDSRSEMWWNVVESLEEKLQNCGSLNDWVYFGINVEGKNRTASQRGNFQGADPAWISAILGFDGCDQWIGAGSTKMGKDSRGIYAVSTWLQFWRQNQTWEIERIDHGESIDGSKQLCSTAGPRQ